MSCLFSGFLQRSTYLSISSPFYITTLWINMFVNVSAIKDSPWSMSSPNKARMSTAMMYKVTIIESTSVCVFSGITIAPRDLKTASPNRNRRAGFCMRILSYHNGNNPIELLSSYNRPKCSNIDTKRVFRYHFLM